jgi:hypothetical protein
MSKPSSPAGSIDPTVDGPVEDLIVAGTAFGEQIFRNLYYCSHPAIGFGLFNLVFSLLPAKIKSVIHFYVNFSDR